MSIVFATPAEKPVPVKAKRGRKAKLIETMLAKDDADEQPFESMTEQATAKPDVAEVKKVKAKRTLSPYNIFFKEQYATESIQALVAKERCGAIAKLWHHHKSTIAPVQSA
jgi:hypothetical protein